MKKKIDYRMAPTAAEHYSDSNRVIQHMAEGGSILDSLSDNDKAALANYMSKDNVSDMVNQGAQNAQKGIQPLGLPSSYSDTGRSAANPGEQLDSVLGAPVRQAIHQAIAPDQNDPWGSLKAIGSQIGKDPKSAPTGYDIASKDLNIDNPYAGAAAATAADLAQLPMGELPGIAGKIEDVAKMAPKSDLASAIEKLRAARMSGESVGKQTGVDSRSWNELQKQIQRLKDLNSLKGSG